MGTLSVLVLALALSADAFSVAVVVGTTCTGARQRFRLSWHFGLFQGLMPALGGLLGLGLRGVVSAWGPLLAAALLVGVGGHMAWEAWRAEPCRSGGPASDPTRGWSLLGLSVATSLDAFVAGTSLVLAGGDLVFAAPLIAVTTGLITLAGMLLGSLIAGLPSRALGVGAGLVLILLGLKEVLV
jgi:putative Mn2+ efflux pump MntP